MNINRGLFRLWVVGSLGWVTLTGIPTLPTAIESPGKQAAALRAKALPPLPEGFELEPTVEDVFSDYVQVAELMGLPPLAAGAVLAGLAWIIGGFRKDEHARDQA
jgi:hypothetical protein